MAEIIASEILKAVLAKLASEAMKKYVRSQGIRSELKKLERTLTQIQNLLNDASQKEIADENVKLWLNSLQHLAYDIDDILDDLATEAMRDEFSEQSVATTSKVRKLIPTCCANFSLSNRMQPKLDKITTQLQNLEKEKNTLGLSIKDEKTKNINRKFQTSLVDVSTIVGRKGEKEALVQELLGDEPCTQNFSVVPIVGMGGVGKTTLARLLYDEIKVFELKAWVCVSDDFDSFIISKVIFQSVGGESKEFEDLNLLQLALRDKLRGKRLLLVLDDVWSESYEDWETLAGPFHACAPGSKIIMTTRKEQLLKKLGYGNLNHLKSLSPDDALCLFAQHALGVNNFDSEQTRHLKQHGVDIVKKCDGLPLALKALGRLLRTKNNEEEYWNAVLNSDIWMLQDGGGIVPALRLSYHDLSARLKQLFAYCSLFPKGYLFDKEKLVLLWMAEGFLHQSSPSNSTAEWFGLEYFDELFSRSFFQHAPNDESLFVMHDLMNDLAKSIAGDLFIRLDNEMENDIRKESLEKYRHMSFVRKEFEAYKKFEAFRRARSLRTFLATSIGVNKSRQKFYLSSKILVNLLPELALLRVLCLSGYEINEVPDSIGNLKHLRYLNLSETKITYLSENVGNLYNLQTLILFGCHDLIKLPNSFIKLKKLRHFDIRDTPLLNKIPLGIGKLMSLQTLSKFLIGGENEFEITELKELKNLCGKISIKGLDKVKDATHAREVEFWQKKVCKLEVEWSDDFDVSRKEMFEKVVLNELKPCNGSLKQLEIVSYGGIEFPNWVGDPSFLNLKHVSLRGCKKCISLPPLGQLPSLKELFIEGLDGVKIVGSELLDTRLSFPSLEILSFKYMLGWEEWSTNGGVVFPRLKELSVIYCPYLNVISLEALPSLRVLKIVACYNGVLTRLVQVASLVTKLEIEFIQGLFDEAWIGVIESLGKVEELKISYCHDLRYLWESEAKASSVLVNLRKLEVGYCNNLVSLGWNDEEEDNGGSNLMTLTSLKMLTIYRCKRMECCRCPNSIETLTISFCRSVSAISFPIGGGRKLKSVDISGFNKVSDKELGGDNGSVLINTRSMQMLEYIEISYWLNLESITELNLFIHLTMLKIENCWSLKSFLDQFGLSNLTSLTDLVIKDCPNMDASFFSNGDWPPKLETLEIGGLKKPMSEWGAQNFPTSLYAITLWGRLEDVSCCSQLTRLFPLSLTYLGMLRFENLESVSTGLQQLTSLQHLQIWFCPKVMDLPEMLLPSLLSLTIKECPKLNESEKASYYAPLVSHIPKINIK